MKSNTDKRVNKARTRELANLRKMGIKIPKGLKKLPWFLYKQNA